eukprot:PhM_4_TR5728/c0_g1_i1/m.90496
MEKLHINDLKRLQLIFESGVNKQHLPELLKLLHNVVPIDLVVQWAESKKATWEDLANYLLESSRSGFDVPLHNLEYECVVERGEGTKMSQGARSHKASLVTKIMPNQRFRDQYWSVGMDGKIKLWDARTLKRVRVIDNNVYTQRFEAPEISMESLMFSGTKLLERPPPIVPISDLGFMAGGAVLGVCTLDKTVNLYDTSTFAHQRRLLGRSIEEEHIMKAEKDVSIGTEVVNDLYLMRLEDAPVVIDFNSNSDRDVLMLGTTSGRIQMYHVPRILSHSELYPVMGKDRHPGVPITQLTNSYHYDGVFTSGVDGNVFLTNLVTGACVRSWCGEHTKGVTCFDISPEMDLIATAGVEREVLLWNINIKSVPIRLRYDSPPISISFNPADNQVIGVGTNEIVTVWDLRTGTVLQTLETKEKAGLNERTQSAFYDKRTFRYVTASYRLQGWDIRRTKHSFPVKYSGHTSTVMLVASLGDDTAVTVDPHSAFFWNLCTSEKQLVFSFDPTVVAATVTTDKSVLFTLDEEGYVIVWNFRCAQMLYKAHFESLRHARVHSLHHICVDEGAGITELLVVHGDHVTVLSDDYESMDIHIITSMRLPPSNNNNNHKVGEDAPSSTQHRSITCQVSVPAVISVSPTRWVLGTNDAHLYVFSLNSHTLQLSVPALFDAGGVGAMSEQAIIGNAFGIKTTDGVLVESAVLVPRLSMVVTVHGNQHICFWNTFKNQFLLLYEYTTRLLPIESQRLIITEPKGELLISADEKGYVYVWSLMDVTEGQVLSRENISLVVAFRAHVALVICLEVVPERELLLTTAIDMYIKVFTLNGVYIGHLGQSVPYSVKDSATWKARSGTKPTPPEYQTVMPTESTVFEQLKTVKQQSKEIVERAGIPSSRFLPSLVNTQFSHHSLHRQKRNQLALPAPQAAASARNHSPRNNNTGRHATVLPPIEDETRASSKKASNSLNHRQQRGNNTQQKQQLQHRVTSCNTALPVDSNKAKDARQKYSGLLKPIMRKKRRALAHLDLESSSSDDGRDDGNKDDDDDDSIVDLKDHKRSNSNQFSLGSSIGSSVLRQRIAAGAGTARVQKRLLMSIGSGTGDDLSDFDSPLEKEEELCGGDDSSGFFLDRRTPLQKQEQ